MTEFMQRRAVPVDGFEIGLRRRDLNIIFGCCIECAISTDPKRNSAGLDQGVDRGFDAASRRRWRSGGDTIGQFLALIGVENRKSFEEWNRLRIFAGLSGASLFVIRHETIRVDNSGTTLPLTHMPSKRQRLPEREPALTAVTMLDRASPEQKDVDPAVRAIGRSVFGHR